jgi:hypothetical protein
MLWVAMCGGAFAEEPTQLYFGDTHLHTSYSFDAFLSRNQSADPDTAYRWAKGKPVIHPYTRARVQISTPLDFLVVSDHAEVLGVMRAVVNETEELGDLPFLGEIKRWYALRLIRKKVKDGTGVEIFAELLPEPSPNPGGDPVADPSNVMPERVLGDMSKTEITAWNEIIDAAERHNEPGKFTTLLGWEWSSLPTGVNLHRVVITTADGEQARQFYPFGSDRSQYPEDLWAWLEKTSKETGAEFVAIPHNSNVSKGYMFSETTLRGQPITVDYARTRMVWEPVVEVTQIKGDSETHPALSPEDPFAAFEPFTFYLQRGDEEYKPGPGDFIRPALRRGLSIHDSVGTNPYKFGLIGSTDSHTGLSTAEESNFWGKMAVDSTPETKGPGVIGGSGACGWDMSAAGLAAVWATENTRQGIFSAFKRREVYATTGPRIRVRFFGGWSFDPNAADAEHLAEIGYAQGVPMGGDLTRPSAAGKSKMQFLVRAVKDPKDANLDRIQIVKGWLDRKGKTHERVFDVAWSEGRELDADGLLPAVGDTVNREIPDYSNTIGAPELSALWVDPTFDPDQSAFYYVRVLQIPTPRHSLYDAVALRMGPPKEWPTVIQERAYTSPIWYTP